MKERESQDNETWECLDRLRERNKEEMTKILETGMQHKADLALGKSKLKEAQKEREDIQRQIKTA